MTLLQRHMQLMENCLYRSHESYGPTVIKLRSMLRQMLAKNLCADPAHDVMVKSSDIAGTRCFVENKDTQPPDAGLPKRVHAH